MTDRLDVILESECTDADIASVTEVFETAGIPAEIRGAYVRESYRLLPWVVIIGGGYAAWTFIKAALQAAGDEAGRDGWRALMRLVADLREARKGSRAPEGTVSIRTYDPPLEIPLQPDLPEMAYRQLLEIEAPQAPLSGILMWDGEAGVWRDAWARTSRCDYPDCHEWATQGRVNRPTATTAVRREFCDAHAKAADAADPRAWA